MRLFFAVFLLLIFSLGIESCARNKQSISYHKKYFKVVNDDVVVKSYWGESDVLLVSVVDKIEIKCKGQKILIEDSNYFEDTIKRGNIDSVLYPQNEVFKLPVIRYIDKIDENTYVLIGFIGIKYDSWKILCILKLNDGILTIPTTIVRSTWLSCCSRIDYKIDTFNRKLKVQTSVNRDFLEMKTIDDEDKGYDFFWLSYRENGVEIDKPKIIKDSIPRRVWKYDLNRLMHLTGSRCDCEIIETELPY